MTWREVEDFPWEFIEKIVFKYPDMTITFKSGNGLVATAPDREVYECFFSKSFEKLNKYQIHIA